MKSAIKRPHKISKYSWQQQTLSYTHCDITNCLLLLLHIIPMRHFLIMLNQLAHTVITLSSSILYPVLNCPIGVPATEIAEVHWFATTH